MNILGVDPSTKKLVGVVGDTHTGLLTGIYGVMRLSPANPQGLREFEAYHWAEDMAIMYDIDVVFIENPIVFRSPTSSIVLGQISGALKAGFYLRNCEVVMVNNSHWKHDVIGPGRIDKDRITSWVRKHQHSIYQRSLLPNGNPDQDVCDAVCITEHGLRVMKVQDNLTTGKQVLRKRRPIPKK